jgi:hypothetical protein
MQDISVELEESDKKLLDAGALKAKDDTLSFRRSCREGVWLRRHEHQRQERSGLPDRHDACPADHLRRCPACRSSAT